MQTNDPKQISQQPHPDSTTDLNPDNSYNSVLLSNLYEPEIILSLNTSQCTLNLTQQALGIVESKQEQLSNNIKTDLQEERDMLEQSLTNLQVQEAASASSTSFHIPELTMEEHNYNKSQCSETGLPILDLSSQISLFRPSQIQSPFVNSFAAPLQMDVRRTSTPVNSADPEKQGKCISVNKANSVNNVTYTTSKLSFTVPKDISDLDVASIIDDFESFAKELSLEGISY